MVRTDLKKKALLTEPTKRILFGRNVYLNTRIQGCKVSSLRSLTKRDEKTKSCNLVSCNFLQQVSSILLKCKTVRNEQHWSQGPEAIYGQGSSKKSIQLFKVMSPESVEPRSGRDKRFFSYQFSGADNQCNTTVTLKEFGM